MSRQRRPLSIQALENRKLMAGDAFTITGVDDAIVDGTQRITIAAGQTTSTVLMDMASPELAQHLSGRDADAFSKPEAPAGFTVTINGVNDPPARASVDAEATDAAMAGYGSGQVVPLT